MTLSMPAEWALHNRCWMAWPTEEPRDFYKNLDQMRTQYAEVASAIAEFEPVRMLSNPDTLIDATRQCSTRVEVVASSLNDAWMRDIGPTFVKDGKDNLGGVDWQFNCWGKPDRPHALDAQVAKTVLESESASCISAPIYLEGGAIHTDGEGTLLTTRNVVLNQNRNPGLSEVEAEQIFRRLLGIEKVIWLDNALECDDTDGHVDNLACFSKPGQVIVLTESNQDDSNFWRLNKNLQTLKLSADASGNPIEVLALQQPARQEYEGERLPSSYVNFYIANGGIIMPGFDDKMDQPALELIRSTFPDHEVIQVASLEISKGGGNIHCITQQQPA